MINTLQSRKVLWLSYLRWGKKISQPNVHHTKRKDTKNQSVEEKKDQETETTGTTVESTKTTEKKSQPPVMRKVGHAKNVEKVEDTTTKAKKSHQPKRKEPQQPQPKMKQQIPSSSVPSSQPQPSEVGKNIAVSPTKVTSQIKATANTANNLSNSQTKTSHGPSKKNSKTDSVVGPRANQSIGSDNQPPSRPKPKPKSEEEKVIMRLQAAIEAQEKRLDDIDNVHIPALVEKAKAHLALDKQCEGSTNNKKSKSDGPATVSSNRKAALTCMAHKKRLERESDTIKAAIFNMETQQFMLENILEDRHIKKAMDDAAKAMESLHKAVGGDPSLVATDVTDVSSSITSSSSIHVEDLDDEDLMAELEEWLAPEQRKKPRASTTRHQSSEQLEVLIKEAEEEHDDDDDEVSILTLPSIPKSPLESRVPTRKVKNLVPAVF
mmetsp:Transcript_10800/g.25784  ORF Transcript_10800/g.25784 Transcript_10800/m.25784 type:complete len:436 (+) Transcript_10800:635-1942(+)